MPHRIKMLQRANRSKKNRRRGTAVVEAALVLTLALVTLIVMLEVGVTALVYQGTSERARHGARYAAVNPTETTEIKNVVVYGNPQGTGSPLLGLDPDEVDVSVITLDEKSAATGIVVEVEAFSLFTPFLGHGSEPLALKVSIPIEAVP